MATQNTPTPTCMRRRGSSTRRRECKGRASARAKKGPNQVLMRAVTHGTGCKLCTARFCFAHWSVDLRVHIANKQTSNAQQQQPLKVGVHNAPRTATHRNMPAALPILFSSKFSQHCGGGARNPIGWGAPQPKHLCRYLALLIAHRHRDPWIVPGEMNVA